MQPGTSLKSVATKLSALVRERDTVARYGGDEFVVLLVHPQSVANVREIAKRIDRAFMSPIAIGEAAITISLSIGIIVDRTGYTSAKQVLVEANSEMYQMKQAGAKRMVSISGLARSAPA